MRVLTKRAYRAVPFLLLSASASVLADEKFTTVERSTMYRGESRSTHYVKDHWWRMDFQQGRRMAVIVDCSTRKAMSLDLERREYSEFVWPSGSTEVTTADNSQGQMPAHPLGSPSVDTTDTGEEHVPPLVET